MVASRERIRVYDRRMDAVEHTDVDGSLVLARLARFVCGAEGGPVEGSVKRSIAEGADFHLITRRTLGHGQAVHTGGRSRGSKEEGLEKHD